MGSHNSKAVALRQLSLNNLAALAAPELAALANPVNALWSEFPSWDHVGLCTVLAGTGGDADAAAAMLEQWTTDRPSARQDAPCPASPWHGALAAEPVLTACGVPAALARALFDEVMVSRLARHSYPRKVAPLGTGLGRGRQAVEAHGESVREEEEKFDGNCATLKLRAEEMEHDGNDLFRALSHELFATQEHHAVLRAEVAEHMRRHVRRFAPAVRQWDEYIVCLEQLGWPGDECALHAACECFGVAIHAVGRESWHHRYSPAQEEGSESMRHVFLGKRGSRYVVLAPVR